MVLIGSQYLMGKYYPQRKPAPAATAVEAPLEEALPPPTGRTRGRPSTGSGHAAIAGVPPAARELALETPSIAARVSAAGGRLVSWQLKAYRATGSTLWEELVPLRTPRLPEGPLSVRLADAPESASAPAAMEADGASVTFTQQLAGGRRLVKRLTLPASGYVASLDLELDGPAPESLEVLWSPGLGYSPDEEAFLRRQATYQNVTTAVVLTRKDKLSQGEAKSPALKAGEAPFWAAVRNKYFAAALLAPDPAACEGVTAVEGVAASNGAPHALAASLRFTLQPGARRVHIPLKVYAGPQEVDDLGAAGARLEKVMNLGWFGWLALPMVRVLKFLALFVKNYGVAIILLTLAVRGVLWFPSQWGLKQMKKMQTLQPQITFINEQWKDDAKRKQEEMMRLYKENKINPAGGCLPLLAQMPVFFALYSALSNSIELRGAPFALWIHDLSVKDPLYVLPVLVGGSMWLQQQMMPVTGDPDQAKMMRWMSLAFCFMFLSMPSGLMLYWLASNLVQIAQQWRTRQTLAPAAKETR